MEFKKMDEIQKRILMEVADLHSVPEDPEENPYGSS